MDWMSLTAGAIVVLAALVDTIWTTLWVGGGAGPITRAVSDLSWRFLKLFGVHRLMVVAGPLILTITIVTWLFLLWLGWFLIFWSAPGSLLTTSTKDIAGIADRIYFVGYTIFTLGNGDFSPNGAAWQIATAIASGTGLFTATLAITYLISVISAAVSARAIAAEVWGFGDTAAKAVAAGWDGDGYSGLTLPLQSVASQLTKLSQQYLAYPIFQYFHSHQPGKSPIVGLARVDEVLVIAAHGAPHRCRPPEVILNSVRSAVTDVLESLPRKFVKPASDPLPTPSLASLRDQGQPVVSDEDFASAVRFEQERRKRLRGLLEPTAGELTTSEPFESAPAWSAPISGLELLTGRPTEQPRRKTPRSGGSAPRRCGSARAYRRAFRILLRTLCRLPRTLAWLRR